MTPQSRNPITWLTLNCTFQIVHSAFSKYIRSTFHVLKLFLVAILWINGLLCTLQLSGFNNQLRKLIRKLKILNFNELLTIRGIKEIAKIRENSEFFFLCILQVVGGTIWPTKCVNRWQINGLNPKEGISNQNFFHYIHISMASVVEYQYRV